MMADLKISEEELAAIRTAGPGMLPVQAEGPRLVHGQEPVIANSAAENAEPVRWLPAAEMAEFRSQWSHVQTGFVDEPRGAVEGADKLVNSVMQRIAEGFSSRRSDLARQWEEGGNASTEDLRIALQSYRSFLDRLLKL